MRLHVTAANLLEDGTIVNPREATKEDLLHVHSQSYLDSLKVCAFSRPLFGLLGNPN